MKSTDLSHGRKATDYFLHFLGFTIALTSPGEEQVHRVSFHVRRGRNMIFSLILLLLLTACEQSPKLTLEGTIGKQLESKLVLQQDGDRFSGYFSYLDKPEEQIAVSGTQVGTTLRLEEFNSAEQKLTGIFDGRFDGAVYEGNWSASSYCGSAW